MHLNGVQGERLNVQREWRCGSQRGFGPLAGGMQIGFTGRCGYTLPAGAGLPPRDEYLWRALHLLAAFAFYAGVGAKTTMGMGTARVVTSDGRRPAVSA